MSMAERIIFKVVKDGLQRFIDKPIRFERFLRQEIELEPEEAAKGRLYFAGGVDAAGNTVEARPPTPIHGYARQGGPFPCWALTLAAERRSQDYLDQDGAALDEDGEPFFDEETGKVVDAKYRRVEYTYNFLVITDNADVTLWYYHLLKFIVLSAYDVLKEHHLDDPDLSGADLAPDPRYLPSDVFARSLTLSIQTDETWTTEIAGGGGNKVSGIHIDDDEGFTVGAGSVKAGVKPVPR
jgi:hypothetical protein